MPLNAYIHIPFCKSKCNYCSFTSYVDCELKDEYLNALKKQIEAEYKGEKLNTLYFGGGTPSLLSLDEFKSLFDLFNLEKDAEITVEVNPESVTFEYLCSLRKLGINRLSIGIQTFNEEILNLIGRRHDSQQAKLTVNSAKKAGFDNISIDLIYGLPTQSISDFKNDLNESVGLDVQHISLYGLKIEEGCYFSKNIPLDLPNLDIQADMYLKAVETLQNAGFIHYEVSNFSKLGFESMHNLNYWNNNTYYGFGCAASGYTAICPPPLTLPLRGGGSFRYTNEADIQKYIKNPLKKISMQELSQQEILEEAIFLGFRKIAGININQINQNFRIDFNVKYAEILKKYSNYFIKTSQGYALTLDGILISNEILSEFISD